MSTNEKIKTIDKKIEQNKGQYNLDRQTAVISALSSGNVSKCEFLTGKDVLPEKNLLEKPATMKRFEYSLLGKELKKQTSVAEKHPQTFDQVFNHDKIEKPVTLKIEGPLTTGESSLFYNSKYSFTEFQNAGKYMDDSLVSRYNNYLALLKQRLEEFKKFIPRKAKTKAKKKIVYNNAKKLYNTLLSIYYNDYNEITDEEKRKS